LTSVLDGQPEKNTASRRSFVNLLHAVEVI